jgi:hypothetical protein
VQAVAASALGHIADRNQTRAKAVAAAGGAVSLVRLLSSGDTKVQAAAAGALSQVASANCTTAIVAAGGVPALVRLVGGIDTWMQAKAAAQAAWALCAIAWRGTPNPTAAIIEADGVGQLVKQLSDPEGRSTAYYLATGNSYAAKAAACALTMIAIDNSSAVIQAGAVQPLVDLVGSDNTDVVDQAALALKLIAKRGGSAGKQAIRTAGGVEVLQRVAGKTGGDQDTASTAKDALAALERQ